MPISSSFIHRLRRVPSEAPAVVLLAAYLAVFFIFAAVQARFPTRIGGILYTIGFVPPNLASAWLLWRATRRPHFVPAVARGLRWVAAGIAMLGAGNLAWTVHSQVLGGSPSFGWADPFYLAYMPLVGLGLLKLPRQARQRQERWRLALDAAIVVIGIAVLVSTVVVPALLPTYGSGPMLLFGAAYPLGDVIVLAIVVELVLRGRPGSSATPFYLLLGGLALNLMADLAYQVVFIRTQGASPDWTDPIYAASYLLLVASAAYYAHRPVMARAPEPEPEVLHSPTLLPLYVVAGLAVALCLVAIGEWPSTLSQLGLGVVALVLLLLLRESFAVREHAQLLAERAARTSEVRFEALVRHSTDMVMLLDVEGAVLFASPAVLETLGQGPEELVGLPLLELLHPEDHGRGEEFLTNVTLHPGRTATIRWRMHHAAGEWRILESVATNLLGEPEVRGVVVNSRDLTDRELLEEQLRQAQKMEAIGRMAGGVAHDFNNLLTTILASADFALRNVPPGHALQGDLEEIRHAATRAGALTGQLLAFSRRQAAEPGVHDLRQIIEESTRLLARLVGPGIRLETQFGEGLEPVRIDRAQMEQILLNLCANARDAMAGAGVLRVRLHHLVLTAPLATRFMAVPAGRYVVLEVEDTGIGMEPATLQRVFEPFFTTKPTGQGTGLGLASVYGIVRQSGGYITVDSAPGQGARFRLYFPRSGAVAAALAPAAAPGPVVANGTETVLLVEDEPALLSVAQRILAASGYQVLAAASAEEAEQLVEPREAPVDLLLTDVIMPGASGPTLAARLKRRWPTLRVLFMSGYPGDELGAHGVLEPETELLPKPFTAQELVQRVRDALAAPRPAANG